MSGGLRFAIPVVLFAATLQGQDWKISVVDPLGGNKYSSLRLDSDGNAHAAYFDELQNIVKYGFWDRKLDKWFTTGLDKSGGFCSLTLDSKKRPHISYLEYGTGRLKYAHWNGSEWQKQTVQIRAREISFYTSIAVDSEDHPSISFYEYASASSDESVRLRLRVVMWNGSYWQVRTVDPEPGSGKFNSLASDSAGNVTVAYANVKYEGTSLRFARWNGQTWRTERVEGVGGTGYGAFSVCLALDSKDTPHIAYTDVPNRKVKYATRRDGKWRTEIVDAVIDVSYPDRNGIAVDAEGNPYISFHDPGQGILKIARKTGNVWVTEVVAEDSAGFTSSLQISGGFAWITYADDASRTLKMARRRLWTSGQNISTSLKH